MTRVWTFIAEYSLLLIAGAILALVWANIDPQGYHSIVDFVLLSGSWVGELAVEGAGSPARTLTLRYLVNGAFMALFFAVAGKEVWEAIILEGGPLRGRKAATPLIATLGGMAGPIAVYLGLAALMGSQTFDAVARGWAIPTATDIAFSYLVGRVVFGAGHPAIRFLLLLAIADDAGGLLILALFYPTAALAPIWLVLSLAAALAVFAVFNRLPRYLDQGKSHRPASTWVRTNLSFWPYLGAGIVSWYAFQQSGIHPALGLLPIIPAIPQADRDFGIFAATERGHKDILNSVEHALKLPVQIILFAFGFANAGVEFSAIGPATWLVLLGLLVGKPAGILLFGWFAARCLHLGLPDGMQTKDLFVLGCVAAIGFTVALFVATVAFPAGPTQDAAKMGALFSLGAAIFATMAGKILGVRRVPA